MNDSDKSTGRRKFLLTAAAASVAVGALAHRMKLFPTAAPSPAAGSPIQPGEWVGQTAPDFRLNALSGGKLGLTDFRGKVVLMNFWATWCAPCRVETPWLVEFDDRYRSFGLQIVGISMDDADRARVAEFVQHRNVKYPILLKDDKVSDNYGGLRYLPETFFVGRDGRIIKRTIGVLDKSSFEADIRAALGMLSLGA